MFTWVARTRQAAFGRVDLFGDRVDLLTAPALNAVFDPKICSTAATIAIFDVHRSAIFTWYGERVRFNQVGPASLGYEAGFANLVGKEGTRSGHKVDGARGGSRVDSTVGRRHMGDGWGGRGFEDVIDDGDGESVNDESWEIHDR